jgi:hypothetical protein
MNNKFWIVVGTCAGVVCAACAVLALVLSADFRCTMGVSACPGPPPPPSDADRAAWVNASAAPSARKCDALRQYLRAYPDGAFQKEAQAILSARSEVSTMNWSPFESRATALGSTQSERGSEEAACASALANASHNADSECQIYRSDPRLYRRISTATSPAACDCRNLAIQVPGVTPSQPVWRCTVSMPFVCRGEQSAARTREDCGS